MSNAPASPHRRLWEEHSIPVALVLAILIPGLGHLYQGRTVKGLIYLFGILGLFLWGVRLGEGVVVYNMPEQGVSRRITLHYAAQFCAGLVAYPALFQQQRAANPTNRPVNQLDHPLTAHFEGWLKTSPTEPPVGTLSGTVHFQSENGEFGPETVGTFTGTLDGKPEELKLAGGFYLDRPIGAGFRRALSCVVVNENGDASTGRMIDGTIPRSLWNGYGVPPEPQKLQEVIGRMGKLHELALVFTWIAGLLNILAIWDCVQGPAYGFGDESATANENTGTTSKSTEPPATSQTVTTA